MSRPNNKSQRCKYFSDHPKPRTIDGGCKRRDKCWFSHPDEPTWATAIRPYNIRSHGTSDAYLSRLDVKDSPYSSRSTRPPEKKSRPPASAFVSSSWDTKSYAPPIASTAAASSSLLQSSADPPVSASSGWGDAVSAGWGDAVSTGWGDSTWVTTDGENTSVWGETDTGWGAPETSDAAWGIPSPTTKPVKPAPITIATAVANTNPWGRQPPTPTTPSSPILPPSLSNNKPKDPRLALRKVSTDLPPDTPLHQQLTRLNTTATKKTTSPSLKSAICKISEADSALLQTGTPALPSLPIKLTDSNRTEITERLIKTTLAAARLNLESDAADIDLNRWRTNQNSLYFQSVRIAGAEILDNLRKEKTVLAADRKNKLNRYTKNLADFPDLSTRRNATQLAGNVEQIKEYLIELKAWAVEAAQRLNAQDAKVESGHESAFVEAPKWKPLPDWATVTLTEMRGRVQELQSAVEACCDEMASQEERIIPDNLIAEYEAQHPVTPVDTSESSEMKIAELNEHLADLDKELVHPIDICMELIDTDPELSSWLPLLKESRDNNVKRLADLEIQLAQAKEQEKARKAAKEQISTLIKSMYTIQRPPVISLSYHTLKTEALSDHIVKTQVLPVLRTLNERCKEAVEAKNEQTLREILKRLEPVAEKTNKILALAQNHIASSTSFPSSTSRAT